MRCGSAAAMLPVRTHVFATACWNVRINFAYDAHVPVALPVGGGVIGGRGGETRQLWNEILPVTAVDCCS